MKTVIPTAYTATQAEIDSGIFTAKSGGIIIVVDANGQDSGARMEVGPANAVPVQTITQSGNAGSGSGSLKAWAANTAVEAGEIRRASAAVGTIGIGDFISSNSARTTGATFNSTEAANWTELPDDPDLTAHKSDTVNPHATTKAQVGLGNVDNTSDANKPVSSAMQTALTDGSLQTLFDTMRADSVHFLADATDVNALTTTGWYNCNNATNGPAGGGWYYIFHGVHRNSATGAPTTNYGFQIAKRLNVAGTNNLLMRVQVNGVWSTWATLATDTAATTTVAGLMSGADKTKLDGVATGAEVNVQGDWNQATTTADSYINNKPTVSALEGTTAPVMDGTAAVGVAATSSRSDHVHASDTSRASSASLTDNTINARFRTLLCPAVTFLASGSDLNTLTGTGWYSVQNPANGPTTTNWYYVENIIHRTIVGEAQDLNYKFQRAVLLTDTGNKEYTRLSVANTWTAWAEMANIGDLAAYAPLASPALTGTPTAPTATAGTNTTQVSTTAFVATAIAGRLTHTSQGTLDANNAALVDNAVYTGTNTAAMTNAPTTAWAWTLLNFRMGTWRTQIFIPAGGNIIYKRTVDGAFTGATWQSVTFV